MTALVIKCWRPEIAIIRVRMKAQLAVFFQAVMDAIDAVVFGFRCRLWTNFALYLNGHWLALFVARTFLPVILQGRIRLITTAPDSSISLIRPDTLDFSIPVIADSSDSE